MLRKGQTEKRPTIFIAHSQEGIFVKSVSFPYHIDLLDSQETGSHSFQWCARRLPKTPKVIRLSTYGSIFMGTSHHGGNGVPLGKLMSTVASIFIATDDEILNNLKRDSGWLQQ